MKRLRSFGSVVLLVVFAVHAAFAQASPLQQTKSLDRLGSIKPENLGSYYVGHYLMFARFLTAAGFKQHAIKYFKSLSIALVGEDEARIQSCLRMIESGEGTAEQIDDLLKQVESSLDAKLSGDPGWFYNLGKTYAQFFMTLEYLKLTNDARPLRLVLVNLGQLATRAPADAPVQVVLSLAQFGAIGAKEQMNLEDIAIIKKSVETIDTNMAA